MSQYPLWNTVPLIFEHQMARFYSADGGSSRSFDRPPSLWIKQLMIRGIFRLYQWHGWKWILWLAKLIAVSLVIVFGKNMGLFIYHSYMFKPNNFSFLFENDLLILPFFSSRCLELTSMPNKHLYQEIWA